MQAARLSPLVSPQATIRRLSLVVPVFNEAGNVLPLLERIHSALERLPQPWEVVLVDDGSTDATWHELQQGAAAWGSHVRPLRLLRNFGQTAAMQAGIDAARGSLIALLDADLQNDPADIPRLLQRLLADDLDCVAGWRRQRKDNALLRNLPSRLANHLIRRVTGVRLHDYGCSLKVFRADVLRRVRLYGDMHRFIPAWLAMVTSPARIAEEEVTHQPRRVGQSKYGLSRTFLVLADMMAVWFFMRYRARPAHFFGGMGLLSGGLGALALGYLFVLKIFLGEAIGGRPLLLVGVVLVLASLQFVTTGFLAELMTRTWYESRREVAYELAEGADRLPEQGWCGP